MLAVALHTPAAPKPVSHPLTLAALKPGTPVSAVQGTVAVHCRAPDASTPTVRSSPKHAWSDSAKSPPEYSVSASASATHTTAPLASMPDTTSPTPQICSPRGPSGGTSRAC